jgi:hypothetical protein
MRLHRVLQSGRVFRGACNRALDLPLAQACAILPPGLQAGSGIGRATVRGLLRWSFDGRTVAGFCPVTLAGAWL